MGVSLQVGAPSDAASGPALGAVPPLLKYKCTDKDSETIPFPSSNFRFGPAGAANMDIEVTAAGLVLVRCNVEHSNNVVEGTPKFVPRIVLCSSKTISTVINDTRNVNRQYKWGAGQSVVDGQKLEIGIKKPAPGAHVVLSPDPHVSWTVVSFLLVRVTLMDGESDGEGGSWSRT